MYRCKYYLLIIIIVACNACKGPFYNFRPENDLNENFFKKIPYLDSVLLNHNDALSKDLIVKCKKKVGDRSIDLRSMVVFRATFTERLVERNSIPEWKLINDNSAKLTSEVLSDPGYGSKSALYLFILNPGKANKICIFLGTRFDIDSNFKSLGPAYMGYVRRNQINMKCALQVNTKDGYCLALADRHAVNMVWYLDDEPLYGNRRQILIKRIDYDSPNKIGGRRTVLYPIDKVFDDSTALIFNRIN